MSSTNRVQVAIGRNTATALPLSSPPTLQKLRLTAAPSLAFTPNTIVSDEIRSDRQVADLIPVGAEAGGDVNGELSYGAVDDIITAAMFNTWTDPHNDTIATGSIDTDALQVDGDEAAFIDNNIVKILDAPASLVGEGLYRIDGTPATGVDIALVPYDSNTLNLAASMTALEGLTLQIVGVASESANQISVDTTGGLFSLEGSVESSLAGCMGNGQNLVPGQFVKLSGFDAAADANNVWLQITEDRGFTNGGYLFIADSASDFVTDGGSVTPISVWFGGYVRNGADSLDDHVFLVDERFLDHSPVSIISLIRMAVGNLNITLDPQAIAAFVATFFGTDAEAANLNDVNDLYGSGDATINDAPTNDVFNTSSNIGRLGRGSDAINNDTTNCVLQATVEINNNLERNNAVGVFGACSISVGELAVTGNLTTYFDDLSLYQDLINGAETSIDFGMTSNDGQTLLVEMPRVKFSGGAPQVPGKNQQVTLPLTYQALLDADFGYTISFQRFFASQ